VDMPGFSRSMKKFTKKGKSYIRKPVPYSPQPSIYNHCGD